MPVMELTTTSYALLGLLSLRPWTTYELAQQVQRSLRRLWPVAERQLYEQPKALAAHGYATARKERTGDRPRTVYRITPKGRRALRAWLADTEGDFGIRSDLVLKAFFAEQAAAPKAALLAQVEAVAALVGARRDAEVDLYEATRAEGFPFPDRRHVSTLVARLGFELQEAVERWASWAAEEVASWPDDLAPPRHADELMAATYVRATARER